MEQAKTDITYCVHPTCRCWRHESNFKFREDGLYSFMACCEKLDKKRLKELD